LAYRRVSSEAVVDNAVTDAAHIRPEDRGDVRLDASGNVLGGFADDRRVAGHRIDCLLVIGKASKEDSAVKLLDLLNGSEEIVDD
jgi:hypothetical protein